MMRDKSLIVSDRVPEPGRKLLNLVQQLLKSSKSNATQAIQNGRAWVNDKPAFRADQILEPGDRLTLVIEPEVPRASVRGRATVRNVEVVYEDDELIVVNKPPALLTVPTHHQEKNTLIAAVNRHLREEQGDAEGFCVHRLDRGVSGLLVFAKSLEIAEALRSQFEARKPLRRYAGIVAGQLEKATGTFQSYLATDSKTLHRYSTDREEDGQFAVTHYAVAEQWAEAALVEVWLETGRRNQIRVHFAEDGHPILGDERYGFRHGPFAGWPHRRLALHARTLGFTHPQNDRTLEFHSKLPPEMIDFQQRQRAGTRRNTNSRRNK